MSNLLDVVMHIKITDIIDIAIISYVFYKTFFLIKETRAEQLVKGILILLLINKVSEFLELQVVHWIIRNTLTVGLIAMIIVFQPELRRLLESLGRTRFLLPSTTVDEEDMLVFINELVAALKTLSDDYIGALVVLEKDTGLSEIIQTGTKLDAIYSKQLLINIFMPRSPLHDGAVIIRNQKIVAAGCFLPLTDNKYLNQELGTRHRAALGISERSDSVTLIVSEESGEISIARAGKLLKGLSEESIKDVLKKSFVANPKEENFFKKGGFFNENKSK